jgi:tellurite resistance protein TehA-like permease
MADNDRVRVVFHGAVVMLVGLLSGLPTVNEEEPARLWHTAHESLVLIGVLLFAVSSVLPLLTLPKREARALVWSVLATGYGLMVGLIIQAVMGQHAFGPSSNPVLMLGFIANATGMLGSVLTASLTIMGARIPRRGAATSFSAPD